MNETQGKIQESEIANLSHNLQRLLADRRLSVTQVADKIGVPMMTIRRLVLGETTDPRISTLKMLADHFDMSVDNLISDDFQLGGDLAKSAKPQFVPVLDWEMAASIASLSEVDLSNWQAWQAVPMNKEHTLSSQSFALESRPSMFPRYSIGTIFIVDPEVTPQDGDLVLVRIRDAKDITLRKLMIDPPEWNLVSVTADAKNLAYSSDQHTLVGVVVLTMLYNRS